MSLLIRKPSYRCTMLKFNPISATVVKFGMYLAKLNQYVYKNFITELLVAPVPNEVDQQTVLNILGWEPLNQQRVKAKAKLMFKTLNNMGPNFKKITFKTAILNHNLRDNSSSIRLPKPNTNMKKSFMYDGASIWNSIPQYIRESKSISCFKRKIATLSF